MADVVITPASGLIDFSNTSGISSATIQLDGSGNLNISAAAGDIQIGDTSSDIYIGDGINNVDIIFEQDGEIRGLTGKTITFGQSDSYLAFAGDVTGDVTFTGKLVFPDNATVPDNPTNQQYDYMTFGANGSISQITGRGGLMITSSDDSLVLANGDVGRNFTDSNINVDGEDIFLLSDGGVFFKTNLQNGWGVNNYTFGFTNTGQAQFESLDLSSTGTGLVVDGGMTVAGVSTISVNSSSDALRITQTGTGNALVVEDSANPDSTPFVIGANGSIGIGTNNTNGNELSLYNSTLQISNSTEGSGTFSGLTFSYEPILDGNYIISWSKPLNINSGSSDLIISGNRVGINSTSPIATLDINGSLNVSGVSTISVNSSSDALRITQTGTGNALVVEDSANPDSSPFIVDSLGRVGVGETNPKSSLHVSGTILSDATFVTYPFTPSSIFIDEYVSYGRIGVVGPDTSTLGQFVISQYSTDASSSNQSAFLIDSSGNAGIGTLNPSQKLDVNGALRLRGALYDGNNQAGSSGQVLSSTGTALSWIDAPGGFSVTNDTTTNSTYYPVFVNVTSGDPTQTSVSSTKLNFNPSSGNFSATQFTSLSDRTKKTNIRPVENALEITKQLEGVRFDWIDNDKPSVGLIAQDVEKVLPELVETSDDGTKSVSYGNIIGVLIEAIKEQQKLIDQLMEK